jgi:hypothetical protein
MPNDNEYGEHSCVHVSLKEFVEQKIAALKELLKTEIQGRDRALKLQATDYLRRLEELNHAHEANIARNAEFVGREKFEAFEREYRQYKEANDRAVESKAKAIAEAVEQKADAANKAVDTKAVALKTEFDEYKSTQATAVALAAGAKQGVGKLGALGIALVGVIASLIWAASLAVNIYMALHPAR